jgi:hypothetical protein
VSGESRRSRRDRRIPLVLRLFGPPRSARWRVWRPRTRRWDPVLSIARLGRDQRSPRSRARARALSRDGFLPAASSRGPATSQEITDGVPIALAVSSSSLRSERSRTPGVTSTWRESPRHTRGTNVRKAARAAKPNAALEVVANALGWRLFLASVVMPLGGCTSSTSWGSQVRALHRPLRESRLIKRDFRFFQAFLRTAISPPATPGVHGSPC